LNEKGTPLVRKKMPIWAVFMRNLEIQVEVFDFETKKFK